MHGVEAQPQGVAAHRWRDAHVQEREVGRLGHERHVGVPTVGLGRAFGSVLEVHEHRRVRRGARVDAAGVQWAEVGCERELLLLGEVLIAQEHHQVVEQGPAHLGRLTVGQWCGRIDAVDHCAYGCGQRFDGDRLIAGHHSPDGVYDGGP